MSCIYKTRLCIAQPGRAVGCNPMCRRFKSCCRDFYNSIVNIIELSFYI